MMYDRPFEVHPEAGDSGLDWRVDNQCGKFHMDDVIIYTYSEEAARRVAACLNRFPGIPTEKIVSAATDDYSLASGTFVTRNTID